MQKITAGDSDPQLQDRVAGLYYFTGAALEKSGRFEDALQSYRTGASIREPIAEQYERQAAGEGSLSRGLQRYCKDGGGDRPGR